MLPTNGKTWDCNTQMGKKAKGVILIENEKENSFGGWMF